MFPDFEFRTSLGTSILIDIDIFGTFAISVGWKQEMLRRCSLFLGTRSHLVCVFPCIHNCSKVIFHDKTCPFGLWHRLTGWRGGGVDSQSCRYDFKDWLSPASKSRYDLNMIAKAKQPKQPTNLTTNGMVPLPFSRTARWIFTRLSLDKELESSEVFSSLSFYFKNA